jgi:acyl carrier protein
VAWGVPPSAVLGLGSGWRAGGCLAGVFGAAAMLDPALAALPAGSPDIPVWLSATGRWTNPGVALIPPRAPVVPGQRANDGDTVASVLRDTGWTPLALYPPEGGAGDPGVSALLAGAGRAWLAGAGIDWARFYAGRPVQRVPLPAVPFARRRYWLDSGPAAPDAAQSSRGTLGERFDSCSAAEKAALLTRYLQEELGRALGTEQLGGELPDDDRDLFDMNAESLMLIEITAKLSDELQHPIPTSAFVDYPTIRSFVANLGELLGFS